MLTLGELRSFLGNNAYLPDDTPVIIYRNADESTVPAATPRIEPNKKDGKMALVIVDANIQSVFVTITRIGSTRGFYGRTETLYGVKIGSKIYAGSKEPFLSDEEVLMVTGVNDRLIYSDGEYRNCYNIFVEGDMPLSENPNLQIVNRSDLPVYVQQQLNKHAICTF